MSFSEYWVRVTRVILGIGIGWLLVSCAAGPPTTRFIVNQPDRTVGMEVTYREGSPEYFHPNNLNAEMLDRALQAIQVQPSSLLDRLTGSSSINQEAFSQEQREFLAAHLSTALSQATPLETVTFYQATPRGNGIWEITSGGLYLEEATLHMVLPNYRQTMPAKSPPQIPREHPLARIGESLHLLKATAPARQLTHSLATELWEPQTPHFVISLKELADSPLTSPSEPTPSPLPNLDDSEPIKQRLNALEDLYQEGLVSQEEYQHKRQEILNEL